MVLTFIAHAGIHIEELSNSILIDPWFRGSSLKKPVIESVGNQKISTIDFQIPPTTESIQDYTPRVILLSHFHAHHAPFRDVSELVGNSKEVIIAYPKVDDNHIKERLKEHSNVIYKELDDGESFSDRGIEIQSIRHTSPGHTAWFVKSGGGSVLHIADARENKDLRKKELDGVWDTFADLKPDVVFLNMGGNSLRLENDGERFVTDAYSLSPGSAANLIKKIHPKAVVPIGCYNKSLWSTLKEYVPPSYIIEDQFYWALSWVAPETRAIFMKPGETIELKQKRLFGSKTDYQL